MILQQVLIKLLQSTLNIVDVLKHKFDEMLAILGHLFDHLASQAPTSEVYDALTLQLNIGLQKVFEKFSDLKDSLLLAPTLRSSDARGGEGPIQKWKPASEFSL